MSTPGQHWDLDESGQPTGSLIERRRRAEFITPIPKPKKRKGSPKQEELVLHEGRRPHHEEGGVRPRARNQRGAQPSRYLPQPVRQPMTGDAGTGATACSALAATSSAAFVCFLPQRGVETATWFTELASHLGAIQVRPNL